MMETTSLPGRPIDAARAATVLGDPDRSPMALTFRAALIVLAAREVGQNVERLARRTGTSRSFVGRCARRLLDHGVWADGQTVCEWGDEGPAHPSFWNDVAVAEGKMGRRTDPSGAFEWMPVGDWIKFYEYRDRVEPEGAHYVPHPRTLATAPAGWDPGEVADADVDPESERDDPPVRPVRRAALPVPEPAVPVGAGTVPPAVERPRPRLIADDPVGRLFPDAQWMG